MGPGSHPISVEIDARLSSYFTLASLWGLGVLMMDTDSMPCRAWIPLRIGRSRDYTYKRKADKCENLLLTSFEITPRLLSDVQVLV